MFRKYHARYSGVLTVKDVRNDEKRHLSSLKGTAFYCLQNVGNSVIAYAKLQTRVTSPPSSTFLYNGHVYEIYMDSEKVDGA